MMEIICGTLWNYGDGSMPSLFEVEILEKKMLRWRPESPRIGFKWFKYV